MPNHREFLLIGSIQEDWWGKGQVGKEVGLVGTDVVTAKGLDSNGRHTKMIS